VQLALSPDTIGGAVGSGPPSPATRLRPYLAAGVVIVGASLIAANPVAPALPDIQERAVQLTSGVGDLATPYVDLVTNTFDNLQNIAQGVFADPLPVLQQVIANQAGYGETIVNAFQGSATALATNLGELPTNLQPAFSDLASGDITGAVTQLQTALLDLLLTVNVTGSLTAPVVSLGGPLGDLLPILNIPAEVTGNFANLVSTLTDTSITLDTSNLLAPEAFFGLPLQLGFGLLGAPISTLDAIGASGQTFVDAVGAGDPLAALGALVDAPAVIANGFLNGENTITQSFDLGGLDVSQVLPVGGLLAPLEQGSVSVLGLTLPLSGTPFGGLVTDLLNFAPQQLAQALGASASATAPAADSASAAADLTTMLDPSMALGDPSALLDPTTMLGDLSNLFDSSAITDIGTLLSADLAPNLGGIALDLLTSF
jgi:hypothetical protein